MSTMRSATPDGRLVMERKTPLKADPDKTRAWRDRSARTAAENARDKPRAPLARTELKAKPGQEGLTRSAKRAAGRKARVEGNPLGAEAVPFKARTPARGQRCFRCNAKAEHWHHWIPQEHLRVMARGLLRIEPVQAVQKRLRAWLRDPRILSPVCEHCHAQGESARPVPFIGDRGARQGRFVRDEVPESAGEAAMDLDELLEAAGRQREAVERLLREWR